MWFYMQMMEDKKMAYYKCKKCGAEFNNMSLAKYATSINCPECNSLTEYSAADEELWYNEKDENGDLIRPRFNGTDEMDARQKAADYFRCDPRDVPYFIVQRKGLFKPFIICASKPTVHERDESATRILMWEYENRPKIWADINLEKKTILYPNELGDKVQNFEKIVGLKKAKDTGACKDFILTLEPQGDVIFSFYPGYFNDIDTLIQMVNEICEPVNHGMFIEKLSTRIPFDAEQGTYFEISCGDFCLNGRMRSWKKEDKLCMLDTDKCQGTDILIDKIKYFRLIGQKYVTTEITGGGGGGSSLKGAVIGGLIAGDVGAVVGSRKAVDEVKGTSTVHDEQVVLLYSSDLKQVITFNSNAYSILTKLIPEKEYEVVVQSGKEAPTANDTKSAADAVREYKKLLDEGIISTEEFERKKKELLGL